MSDHKCENCGKEFGSEEGLKMHMGAKHPETLPEKKSVSKKSKKKWIFWGVTIIILGLIAWGSIALMQKEDDRPEFIVTDLSSIPPTGLHWHPRITINIDGARQTIPVDIGIRVGRVVDRAISGHGGGSPTHTHSSDGIIHLENLRPRSAPETLTIGYFFYVWDRQFNSTCIFDKCGGTMKITVNGVENFDYENYLMQDEDEIIIEYETKPSTS